MKIKSNVRAGLAYDRCGGTTRCGGSTRCGGTIYDPYSKYQIP